LEAGLWLKPEIYEFYKETVRYLGLTISTTGISIYENKVETVQNWSREKKTNNGLFNNLFEVQLFLGFFNNYRQFISKYSENAELLTRLTKNDEPSVWESEQQLAFEMMVTAFTTAPALRHSDHEGEVSIETGASEYVSAGVLWKRDDEGQLHHMPYYSKVHSPAECNYDIYDKEWMTIIKAHEDWWPECEGAAYPLQLIPDHKNLEYCMTKKLPNWRQASWSEFLTRFDYEIVNRLEKCNRKVDELTMRPGDLPEGGDRGLKNMEQVILKQQNLLKQLRISANDLPVQVWPSVSKLFDQAYQVDAVLNMIFRAIQRDDSLMDIMVTECLERDGQ
jgi:hypothetical protein